MPIRILLLCLLSSAFGMTGMHAAQAEEAPPVAVSVEPSTSVEADGVAMVSTGSPTSVEVNPSPTPEATGAAIDSAGEAVHMPNPESSDPASATSPSPEPTGQITQGKSEEMDRAGAPVSGESADTSPEGVAMPGAESSAEPVIDARAVIGDFDCVELAVDVTLDNTRSTVPFSFRVWEGDAASPSYDETFDVGAGATEVVSVPLVDNTRNRVFVRDARLPATFLMAYRPGDCGTAKHDPAATITPLDCATLTVDVTLDNSKSTVPASYLVVWGSVDSGLSHDDYVVPAGETKILTLPVPQGVRVEFTVYSTLGFGHLGPVLASAGEDCRPPREERASLGEVNCSTLTIPVTLDNSRSANPTEFYIDLWRYYPNWPDGDPIPDFFETYQLAPAETRVVQLPVLDHSGVSVAVGSETDRLYDGPLASSQLDVSCTHLDARANIGDVNCNTLTVPITLDNTRSEGTALFEVRAFAEGRPFNVDLLEDLFDVGPRATRVVQIPVTNPSTVHIFLALDNGQAALPNSSIDVACQRPAARPTPRVSVLGASSGLPATGGAGLALPLLGLALLTGGAALNILARKGTH